MENLETRVAVLENNLEQAVSQIKEAVVDIRELVHTALIAQERFKQVEDHETRIRAIEVAKFKTVGMVMAAATAGPFIVQLLLKGW